MVPPGKLPAQVPRYICFFQGSRDKLASSQNSEEVQREWLMSSVCYHLCVASEAPTYSQRSTLFAPFHSPLVLKSSKLSGKSKRKFVTYFDVGDKILQEPSSINSHLASELDPSQYPVVLFTYADLLEPHPAILSLVR